MKFSLIFIPFFILLQYQLSTGQDSSENENSLSFFDPTSFLRIGTKVIKDVPNAILQSGLKSRQRRTLLLGLGIANAISGSRRTRTNSTRSGIPLRDAILNGILGRRTSTSTTTSTTSTTSSTTSSTTQGSTTSSTTEGSTTSSTTQGSTTSSTTQGSTTASQG